MDSFDDEAIKKYKISVAHYQQNKKDDIEAAENRRKLRLKSIEICYIAEEQAALQDFEDKKSLLFDKLKEDLQKKISQIEDEIYAYREKKKTTEMSKVFQKKRRPVRGRKLPPAKPKKKSVEVRGPYIVYMLKEDEIEEDLRIIRKALRTRELTPETQESDLESETIHDYGALAEPLNNMETNLNEVNAFTSQPLLPISPIAKSNGRNNFHMVTNLGAPSANNMEESNNLTKFSPTNKIPFLSPVKRQEEKKYQNPVSANKAVAINTGHLETPADTPCQACLLESQSSGNQLRFTEEVESECPPSEDFYGSCDMAHSEVVYYSESLPSLHQEPLEDLNSFQTHTEIVDYSETQTRTLSSSFCHSPFAETFQIVSTKQTKIVYITSGQLPTGETVEINTSPSPVPVGEGYSSPSISNINNSVTYTDTSATGTSYNSIPVNEKPEDLSVRKYTPEHSSKKRVYSPAIARPTQVLYYRDRKLYPANHSPTSFNEFQTMHSSSNFHQIEISQSDLADNVPTVEISESVQVPTKPLSSSKEL